MVNHEKLFIGGSWVSPSSQETIDVINPATEAVIGRVPAGNAEDVDRAVAAARAAGEAWAATSVARRCDLLQAAHEVLTRRSEEIAELITGEVGMPLKLSRKIQAGLPALTMKNLAELARQFPFEEQLGHSLVVREPVGVVACITPWNYPLHQIVAKVAPALAAGCTLVLKPSEVAPLNAFVLAEVFAEIGLPGGVFNLVSGDGASTGEALAAHPDIDIISLTGSTTAGKRVAALAAGGIKRVALELGGKSPAVIFDDADLATAVKATVNSCFINSGQTCNATTRLLVPQALYDQASQLAVQLAETFQVGDPIAETTKMGPLVSARQRDRVRDYVRQGVAEGAELLCGGADQPADVTRGYYVRPTVFGGVTGDMTLAREEIFGPVLVIMTYRDEDDAVRLANATDYGLAATVWSGDQARALRVARRIKAGQIDINGARFNPQAPFGGFKQSGIGRELGPFGLEEFCEIKSLQL